MDLSLARHHPFIETYLRYVELTESPRLFHIWAALSGISATLGRRCWFDLGTGPVFPNMYIILVGPPALRKSTAFLIMARLLKANTGVRFAPDDTSGQRQGLIKAMVNMKEDGADEKDKEIIARMAAVTSAGDGKSNFTSVADLQGALDDLGTIHFDTRDPHSLFVAASELNSVLGEGNTALLTFLQKMFDGDDYIYELKNSTWKLENALLGLIGATTPSQIALALPPEAVGQGFTSRCIFVHADKKYARKIARPKLDAKAGEEIGELYSTIFNDFEGAFVEDPAAANHIDALYERGIVIKDPRFVHYADRRDTHLKKLSMVLAASRLDKTIRDIDVSFADQLLLFTEEAMPDALGEYGMNKLGAAKQRLLDFIKDTVEPIPTNMLYAMMARDISQMDYKKILNEFHNAGKLTVTTLPVLGQCIIAVADTAARKARRDLSDIERLMSAN